MSQGNRNLSEDDADSVIKDCARFILNKGGTKVPIKRSEVLKHLTSIKEGLSKNANQILLGVSRLLKEVYGYKLIEGNGKIILVTCDEAEDLHESVSGKEHIILIATLSHIFMNGGSVKEDALWRFLEKAGLLGQGDNATKKILTHQFTKELYLNYIKIGEADNVRYVFEWGTRANEEMPKQYLLKKIGEAFDRPPEYWCEQNKDALQN